MRCDDGWTLDMDDDPRWLNVARAYLGEDPS